MFKRIIYLGYYIKKMDWELLFKFFRHVSKEKRISYFSIAWDNVSSVFKYNISPLEYFQFRFYEIQENERDLWAGTGFMYETINKLNPSKVRVKLADKIVFLNHYKNFVIHTFATKEDVINSRESFKNTLENNSGKIVIKNSLGQCGRGVEVISSKGLDKISVLKVLNESGNDLVEEFVQQHEDLNELSSSGLNTLRVITQINKNGAVDILGVRLRITINSHVDNLAAGNIAAPVNMDTGIVEGPGVYSDITKEDIYTHPVSNVDIIGFKVPYFKEALDLAKKAALYDTDNSSIGWDIAITPNGPGLIEGNHDWCKLLWQLPVKKGLKSVLQQYV